MTAPRETNPPHNHRGTTSPVGRPRLVTWLRARFRCTSSTEMVSAVTGSPRVVSVPEGFWMVFPGQPPSGNAGNAARAKNRIQAEARRYPIPPSLLKGSLYLRLVWFHSKAAGGDVDNAFKRLQDALKGLVYADDSSVVKVAGEKVDLRQGYELVPGNTPQQVLDDVADAIATSMNHFVFLEVGALPSAQSPKVVFGPIDGGAR
jgi:hypothetical protein